MCSVAESHLTLCDSMDCSLPGSPLHGISPARILKQVTISLLQGFPTKKLNSCLLHCRRILYHWVTRKAHAIVHIHHISFIHLSIEEHTGFFHLLTIMINACYGHMYTNIFVISLSTLLKLKNWITL